MWAVFKLKGKVLIDYCYLCQEGLYTFIEKREHEDKDLIYFISEKNILGISKSKEKLLEDFAEYFI